MDYVLKLNNPENKEIVLLEHLVGGSSKVYTVENQKYSAGGKYRIIEVFSEHAEQLLNMKKHGHSIFRVVSISKNNDEEISAKPETENQVEEIVVDFDELVKADGSLTIEDTTIEIVEEPEQKPVSKKVKRNSSSEG